MSFYNIYITEFYFTRKTIAVQRRCLSGQHFISWRGMESRNMIPQMCVILKPFRSFILFSHTGFPGEVLKLYLLETLPCNLTQFEDSLDVFQTSGHNQMHKIISLW